MRPMMLRQMPVTATDSDASGSRPANMIKHSTDHHSMHTITQLGTAIATYVPHPRKHWKLLQTEKARFSADKGDGGRPTHGGSGSSYRQE